MVVFKLRARTFQISVVIQQLQPPQDLLGAATEECDDVRGTKKTVPVNQLDDRVVALDELHWGNRGSTLETGKAGRLHLAIVLESGCTGKVSVFALTERLLVLVLRIAILNCSGRLHYATNSTLHRV